MEDYLKRHIATSKEIQVNCNLTARQVLSRIKKLGSRIVTIQSGRSPKYALTTNAFGVGDCIHIWEVDEFGKHTNIAELRPLAAGGFFIEKQVGMPEVYLGVSGNGLYSDLPYFLRDMAPQGFLGKKIAEKMSDKDDSFPKRLRDWNTQHIGRYLLANNDISMGNLRFGNNANLKIRSAYSKHLRNDYPKIADNLIINDTVLSSAGGEQQKFTTFCTDINAHVLIKFSPKGNDSNARRWKDILITEHHAAQVINEYGVTTAAETELLEIGDRLFLESKRFDRVGEHGRRSMISLSMIDIEFIGSGISWVKSAEYLKQNNLLSDQDLYNIKILEQFASLIFNTDTHLGNISFKADSNGFSLLPIYDMCSMGFAPKSNGEVTPFKYKEIEVSSEMSFVKSLANKFWRRVANNHRTSTEFKSFIQNYLIDS